MGSLEGRDFLRVADWSGEELIELLDLADRLKDERKRYVDEPSSPGAASAWSSRSPRSAHVSRSSSLSSSSGATPCT